MRTPIDPQIELISRIGEQMDALQRSRSKWFMVALLGWALATWLYFR